MDIVCFCLHTRLKCENAVYITRSSARFEKWPSIMLFPDKGPLLKTSNLIASFKSRLRVIRSLATRSIL
jgi:hypothetical protein